MTIVKSIISKKLVEAQDKIRAKLEESAFVVLREHKKIVAARISEAKSPWAGSFGDDSYNVAPHMLKLGGVSKGDYPEGPSTFAKNSVKEVPAAPSRKTFGKQKVFVPNKKPVENPKSAPPKAIVKKSTGKLAGMS